MRHCRCRVLPASVEPVWPPCKHWLTSTQPAGSSALSESQPSACSKSTSTWTSSTPSDTKGTPKMARGQLRVYLGAAPGVGKTYKMLEEGRRRKQRGTDVVVGFVETHNRKHTQELIGDLEIVPRKTVTYRGADFTEMDVDAVLARAPEVVLVDEL